MNSARQNFNRTAMSRRDFREAHKFLKAVSTQTDSTVRYALLIAAVIAYARPFSGNERSTNAEATRALSITPLSILNSAQIELHDNIIRLRNKLVAHAEFAECPVQLVDSQPDGMTLCGPYVQANGRKYDLREYLELIDLTTFGRIAELFAVHSLDYMHKLKDEMARTTESNATSG